MKSIVELYGDCFERHGCAANGTRRTTEADRCDLFDRHEFLRDPAAFRAFFETSFASSVLQIFQRHVSSLPSVFSDERTAK